ncbi:MAG: HesA/MoeB/ThiF family protein [bacterium]
MDRYNKNKNLISKEEQKVLKNSKVCVLGCGGLGGYIIEFLTRIGIGNISVVDGDSFDVTNLNRQLLATENNIKKNKAIEAAKRAELVNSEVKVKPICEFVSEENATDILEEHDIIIDALDDINTRKIVQKFAEELKIPLIHGAIAGWYGQVCTIMPGDKSLDYIYKTNKSHGDEKELGNPSFTPALVAAIEASEAIKVILNKGEIIRNEIIYIDLLYGEIEKIPLPSKHSD